MIWLGLYKYIIIIIIIIIKCAERWDAVHKSNIFAAIENCSLLTELKMTEWKSTVPLTSSSLSSIAAPQ